jgi:hypothetical protein
MNVYLVFNGDQRRPERFGVITGVTPREDGKPGLLPGEAVEITDDLLSRLNRPTGPQARADFAEFMAGVYNANYVDKKWGVAQSASIEPDIATVPAEPDIVHPGGSIEPYAETRSFFESVPEEEPVSVQSEEEPEVSGGPVYSGNYKTAVDASSVDGEETR